MDHQEKGQPTPVREGSGVNVFNRRRAKKHSTIENPPREEQDQMERGEQEPRVNHNGHKVTRGIEPDGESGRSWFHPLHFFRICWRSSSDVSKCTNLLWPFTIAAMALHFLAASYHGEGAEEKRRPLQLWIFITAYIGMIPAANLVGFAGQELARKVPKVAGVIMETTFGSIVEIILFVVLIVGGEKNVPVIQAAILGSILANMLLCLGTCCSCCSSNRSPY